jgi:hypothetical protein
MAEHAAAFPLSKSEAANVRIATGHAARALAVRLAMTVLARVV